MVRRAGEFLVTAIYRERVRALPRLLDGFEVSLWQSHSMAAASPLAWAWSLG